MAKCDYNLGMEIHEMLKDKGIENPIDFKKAESPENGQRYFKGVCDSLGIDLEHESTCGTPHRLAKMYKHEICWGLNYKAFPHCMITENEGAKDEIVLIRNIEVKSLCEHHFMPVLGYAHVAYIPNEHLMGLSKFNRIVEFFSRRPQLQERLNEQVHATLCHVLKTENVAVIMNAEHFCVKFRGIQDLNSDTVTSKMSGVFKTKPEARAELLALINGAR